ncbi:OmpA family protein [Pseudozobellia thermophila]|uniref:Outer membrane protein OmpA n=1 Tax=Pseudozobellia thermophila TaxID=192903 RepID=A0A1M6IWZ0_9FLAO|nr:OmpA family protein [Pseudozobellia thermophila]SHJ38951.1 Outer membrane protein OmpA [Pseudozobellia thermophila]
MKHFTKGILIGLCLTFQVLFSQEGGGEIQLTSKDSLIARSWHVGLGYNFVDDSGDVFDELFAVGTQWNYLAYPSRINVGRYFKSGLGVEAIASYNKYKVGAYIDGEVNQEETDYYAIDSRLSYDIMKLFGRDSWFDPYVGVGLGYTKANNQPRATYNAVIGFRTWITEHWGLDFSSSGKWRIKKDAGTNHLQHAAGVIYRFGIERELSRKGEEKLAQIEALEQERQRKQDSLDAVQRAKEAEALAQKMAREKALAEKKAAEEAKWAAENERKQRIADEIEALGHAHFPLNSSYLTQEAKLILDGLSELMRKYPKLKIEVSAHTDSRGSSTYNKWLSQRRAKRTVDYLIGKGVDESRIRSGAYGEERLLNECDDHTHCSEDKHRINRRSEFVITDF